MSAARLATLAALLLALGAAPGARAKSAARPAAPRAKAAAPAADDSDAVLVRVGSEAITRRTLAVRLDELPEQYRANYSTPDGKRQLLDRVVEERVWLLDATRHGVPDRPAVRHQIEQQRRDLLIRTWVNELMAANPAPSDSEAKAYYDAHATDFRTPANASVRHIQLKTEADARRVLALARARGADWNQLVQKFTTDTLTRANGGSLGTVTKEGAFAALGMQPALAESALALKDGAIAGPFHTDHGWHVIQVDKVQPDTVRPFEQVRSFIVRQLGQQRSQDYYQEALGRVKASLGVTPDSGAIRSWISARKGAREMFQDAQQAGGAEQRIAAYRHVVDAYPDADISPQALFMVGFINSEELKHYDDAEKAFRELLARYPRSELVPSAQWMVDHMRTEDAPDFLRASADSAAGGARKAPAPKSKSRP